MMLIGLCGPEGAGKSASASFLRRVYGAEICPIAAPLKDMLYALRIDHKHLYGSQKDKDEPLALFNGRSARYAMQKLGTEYGRAFFGDDFWVNAWAASLKDADPDAQFIVADDVRFANESDAITSRGGIVICVVRSAVDFNRVPQHASEDFAAVPRNVVIINDGDINRLETRLRYFIHTWVSQNGVINGYSLPDLQLRHVKSDFDAQFSTE